MLGVLEVRCWGCGKFEYLINKVPSLVIVNYVNVINYSKKLVYLVE